MSMKTMPWLALIAVVGGLLTGCANSEPSAKTTEPGSEKKAPDSAKQNLTWDAAKQAYVEKRDDGSIAYEGDKSGKGVFKMEDAQKRPVTLDRTGDVPVSESGVAEYPGSSIPGKEVSVTKLKSAIMTQYNYKRATTDPIDKVVAFYKEECKIAKEEKRDEKNAMIYQGVDRGDVEGIVLLTGKNKRGDDVDIRIIPAQEELKETIIRVKVTLKGAKIPPPTSKPTPTPKPSTGDKTEPVPAPAPARGGPTGVGDQ